MPPRRKKRTRKRKTAISSIKSTDFTIIPSPSHHSSVSSSQNDQNIPPPAVDYPRRARKPRVLFESPPISPKKKQSQANLIRNPPKSKPTRLPLKAKPQNRKISTKKPKPSSIVKEELIDLHEEEDDETIISEESQLDSVIPDQEDQNPSQPICHFDRLSDDLILRIFSHLPLDTLVKLSEVNNLWAFLRTIHLERQSRLHLLDLACVALLSKSSGTYGLDLRDFDETYETIHLSEPDFDEYHLADKFISYFATQVRHLTLTLDITSVSFGASIKLLQTEQFANGLATLNVSLWNPIWDTEAYHLGASMYELLPDRIRQQEYQPWDLIFSILNSGWFRANLKSLTLQRLYNAKSFEWSHYNSYPETFCQLKLDRLAALEAFHLSITNHETFLLDIFAQLPALEHLVSFAVLHPLTSEEQMESLVDRLDLLPFRQLTELRLSHFCDFRPGYTRCNWLHMERIIVACPSLESVCLYTANLPFAELLKALTVAENLHQLRLLFILDQLDSEDCPDSFGSLLRHFDRAMEAARESFRNGLTPVDPGKLQPLSRIRKLILDTQFYSVRPDSRVTRNDQSIDLGSMRPALEHFFPNIQSVIQDDLRMGYHPTLIDDPVMMLPELDDIPYVQQYDHLGTLIHPHEESPASRFPHLIILEDLDENLDYITRIDPKLRRDVSHLQICPDLSRETDWSVRKLFDWLRRLPRLVHLRLRCLSNFFDGNSRARPLGKITTLYLDLVPDDAFAHPGSLSPARPYLTSRAIFSLFPGLECLKLDGLGAPACDYFHLRAQDLALLGALPAEHPKLKELWLMRDCRVGPPIERIPQACVPDSPWDNARIRYQIMDLIARPDPTPPPPSVIASRRGRRRGGGRRQSTADESRTVFGSLRVIQRVHRPDRPYYD